MVRRRRLNALGGARCRIVKVRVSDSEYRVLRELADERGWSVQRVLMVAALRSESGVRDVDVPSAVGELRAILRSLQGIATNVNQLAKVANASGQVESWPKAEAVVGKVEQLGDRIARKLQEFE